QGAPVAITRIEESVVPFGNRAKINFIIYFENKGDGEVIEGVWVDDVRLANVPISCVRTDRPIKLEKNEEKSISCQTETSVTVGSYLSSLSIRLIYDYTSKVDKTIKIKSLSAD
ncbi:hypothetical protein GOV06_03040, partial [Candidatus Woesearchaeota archaeon]|nr:hypothetical protein [Candidatus Woesearchaeota archaeon]